MAFKKINFDTGEVIGKSGKLYTVRTSLSVERYSLFQIYEKELAYGLTLPGLNDKLKKVYELINKQKFADSAVMIYDIMRGVVKLGERQSAIMKICCLYINAEDEDEGKINQDMIDAKIRDWSEYDVTDFFQVAVSSVNGLIEIYQSVSRDISELNQTVEGE